MWHYYTVKWHNYNVKQHDYTVKQHFKILHGMIIILAVVVSVGSTSRTVSKCQMSS